MLKRHGEKARAKRRGVPIHAYVGPNGGGKSLCMIYDTLPSLAAGRTVLSTVRLLDYDGEDQAVDHPFYERLSRWVQLVDPEHCDILLDEVTGAANSRTAMGLPVQLQNLFVQLRRRDIVLRYTTPNWARADVILREVTQAVTHCRGYMATTVEGSNWPSKRLFRWMTYDSVDWEEWSLQKVERVKPLVRQVFWRPGQDAARAYDTLDYVESLDLLDQAGLCMTCGGRRQHPKCNCKHGAIEDIQGALVHLAGGGGPEGVAPASTERW
jgi:hypothetical protein